jgi:hypothetical protein
MNLGRKVVTPLCIATLIVVTTAITFAQTNRIGGGGEVSPTVVATFEGWDGKLELLVLWRGAVGWLRAAPSQGGANQLSMGAGSYPMRRHTVTVRGRHLELRIDENNIGHIQDQAIPLQGMNVLMLDDVDSQQVRVVGTLLVDAPFPMQLPVAGDPIHTIIEQSAVLRAFVKP